MGVACSFSVLHLFFSAPSSSSTLGLQKAVPAADLLSFRLLHLSPVRQLLLPGAVQAQGDPANHLLALHTPLVVNRKDESDVRKLEQRHLEHKRLLVGGVGLPTTDGRLTLGHFLTHGVQQSQLYIRVCSEGRQRQGKKRELLLQEINTERAENK